MSALRITNKLLSHWWKIVLHLDDSDSMDTSLVLAGMEACLEHFHLPQPPIQQLEKKNIIWKDLPEPGFENLNMPVLTNLRQSLLIQKEKTTTTAWAEKLLRFCEIRLPTLKVRARRKWGDKRSARLNFLQVAAFLLDYGMQTGDLRYLNTVLKLCDQRWLVNPRTMKADLRKGGEITMTALFQIRILLQIEYALDVLKAENS